MPRATTVLTADAIRQVRIERGKANHETYRRIYAMVCERIKSRVHGACEQTRCTVDVPRVMLGRPSYKIEHAMSYVANKLRHGGFRVTEHGPAELLVDWSARPAARRVRPKPPPSPHPRRRPPDRVDPAVQTAQNVAARLRALRDAL